MEKLKAYIVKILCDETGVQFVYEKSGTPTRRKEGLEDFEGWLIGEREEPFIVEEHALKFSVNVSGMQKTGFFLDQREMRQLVRGYAKDKTVLNCFGYTGGFSVYACAGGRGNFGYNEDGTAYLGRYNWSQKFNVFEEWNTKTNAV
jgi:23S rRNA (cytosine1962-C5)-methyltransferase